MEIERTLTVAMIRQCRRALENMEPHPSEWSRLSRIVADDLRIQEICEERRRDYRTRHATAISLEIEAFEDWQHKPDPADDRRKRRAASIIRARNWK